MRAHKKLSLISLAASTMLATSFIPVAAAETSSTRGTALVERFRDVEPAASTVDTREDAKRYAAAEQAAPQAKDFNGGAAVVIIGSTAAMVLLLLLVLLVV